MEPELIAIIALLILIAAVVLAGIWIWRGVRLAQSMGQPRAATRWHWYVRARRRLDRRRVLKTQGLPGSPPPVTLEIHSAAHSHRAKYTRRRARDKRAK